MISITTAIIIAFLGSLAAALGWKLGAALYHVLDDLTEALLEVTVGKWMEKRKS